MLSIVETVRPPRTPTLTPSEFTIVSIVQEIVERSTPDKDDTFIRASSRHRVPNILSYCHYAWITTGRTTITPYK
jgi:hypothetical protein